ncbi:MAG: hypothetical protein QNL04_12515 [SAR324 cluster bacterium]|nr:hypothetical protein [SAR324 cluster bacterium]
MITHASFTYDLDTGSHADFNEAMSLLIAWDKITDVDTYWYCKTTSSSFKERVGLEGEIKSAVKTHNHKLKNKVTGHGYIQVGNTKPNAFNF